ncbi:1,2-phenylacetyl-CoA epoxidase subunit PaaD [Solimicrobium silvestre]|uniref:Phenylacetate-CoA oxygenase, PaaJ subunit n=1 Tax=Solimicrobium silvestre TaxID=2099400 RepID=A0A2S9H2U4_9BURK|nr:1,2-phenylacetyl-CoA epoxidase subunit PaaD [Solimicrobium silvestre]PRC94277.1 Phenylacetate-CoA oxygenase, PaaJ subunit [Solimicrobium silvestre]
MVNQQASTERIWEWLSGIPDPEMPFLSIVDLGIVRDVHWEEEQLRIVVTPTYSGCPAKSHIDASIRNTLLDRGIEHLALETRLSPAWSTDWLGDVAKAKLLAAGIAPPMASEVPMRKLEYRAWSIATPSCPLCGSASTTVRGEFGSTLCKSLYVCGDCANPFEHFKCF